MRSRGGQLLRTWLAEHEHRQAYVADQCRVSSSYVTHWLNGGRAVPAQHRERIAGFTGGFVPSASWDEPVGPAPGQESPPPPPAGPLPELGTPQEELGHMVRLMRAELAGGGLTVPQRVKIFESLRQALKVMANGENGAAPLHEHPAFGGLVEDLVAAVIAELGPSTPPGVEDRIAGRLEEMQAARATSTAPGPERALRTVAKAAA